MAFEASQHQYGAGDSSDLVAASDDNGKLPNGIRHACLQLEELPVVGTPVAAPAQVAQDPDQGHSSIDQGLHLLAEGFDQLIGGAHVGDEAQTLLPLQSCDVQAALTHRSLEASVGFLVTQKQR